MLPISAAVRKYSARTWVEFAITLMTLKTFNDRFSCSISWKALIAVQGISDLFTEKLPFANNGRFAWSFSWALTSAR